jgi:uncharacterized protein involved in cysteine biosynthesis
MRIKSFWYGLTLPIYAFTRIISKPKLIFWSILPIFVTLVLYSVLFSELQNQARLAVQNSLVPLGLDPHGWLISILLISAKILLFFIGAFTFSMAANLVSCPFNDFLAEQTEAYATPPLLKVASSSITYRARLITLDLFRTLLAAGISLLALFFSWVPFLNFLALLLAFLDISFQFISYPQTRRGQGIGEGLHFLWKHTYACLGFGAIFTFLFSIPILSCLCLPLAVVGGTLLVARAQGGDLS